MTPAAAQAARTLFGVEIPIVLGPMAGGPSTPELAAAVSDAGGLGFLGEAYRRPQQIVDDVAAVRARTRKPFGVNLFVPDDVAVDRTQVGRAVEVLAPYRAELGLPPQVVPERFVEDFDEQLAAVVAAEVPVVSFTFGLPDPAAVAALHRRGTVVGGTATTAAEAAALASVGVDFVVAQGAEAGGHRATFLTSPGDDLIGLVALVPQVLAAVDVPVVAAGGIADGRAVAAVLVLGAGAAQLGTAFLLCPEAGTNAAYRRAVVGASGADTVVTVAFSGRRARGIANRFTREMAGAGEIAPFPVQNALTNELRQAAAGRGDADLLSLWAGQGVGLTREVPAGELVALLAREAGLAAEPGSAP